MLDQSDKTSVTLQDILKHPVGLSYFKQHLANDDPSLAKLVKCATSIEKYKKCVVPEKKLKKAAKIFKKHIKGNTKYFPKEVQAEIAGQVCSRHRRPGIVVHRILQQRAAPPC